MRRLGLIIPLVVLFFFARPEASEAIFEEFFIPDDACEVYSGGHGYDKIHEIYGKEANWVCAWLWVNDLNKGSGLSHLEGWRAWRQYHRSVTNEIYNRR